MLNSKNCILTVIFGSYLHLYEFNTLFVWLSANCGPIETKQ